MLNVRLWTRKGYNGPFTPHWGYRGHRKRRGVHVPGPCMSNMGFSHSKCHFQDVLIQFVLRVVSVNSFRVASTLRVCTDVDSDVCKCRCRMSTGFPDSKKCQCRLKRPANVEHMSMSLVLPNVDPIWSTSVHLLSSISLSLSLFLFLSHGT